MADRNNRQTGHKGYRLEPGRSSGSYKLVSPIGLVIARLSYAIGRKRPHIGIFVEGLKFNQNLPTDEQVVKDIVHNYEILTTTRIERFRNRLSGMFSHGAWSAIAAVAATIAAVVSILVYLNTQGHPSTPSQVMGEAPNIHSSQEDETCARVITEETDGSTKRKDDRAGQTRN